MHICTACMQIGELAGIAVGMTITIDVFVAGYIHTYTYSTYAAYNNVVWIHKINVLEYI